MEKVTIWYLTNHDDGTKVATSISSLGLTVSTVNGTSLNEANISDQDLNLFIIDLKGIEPERILQEQEKDRRLQGYPRFILLGKKEIQSLSNVSYNMMHLEFISRPVIIREFMLLIEKTVIVERYRALMKDLSHEAETNIETFEGLMDINRKSVFSNEKEKEAFQDIIQHERDIMKEQSRLNKAIQDFTMLRQSEMFDMQSRIKAEEMLAELRRRELLEANEVIEAQEHVIDYSSHELAEAQEILDAAEHVQELSRSEALELHNDLEREKKLNQALSYEVERLLSEVEKLRDAMS